MLGTLIDIILLVIAFIHFNSMFLKMLTFFLTLFLFYLDVCNFYRV